MHTLLLSSVFCWFFSRWYNKERCARDALGIKERRCHLYYTFIQYRTWNTAHRPRRLSLFYFDFENNWWRNDVAFHKRKRWECRIKSECCGREISKLKLISFWRSFSRAKSFHCAFRITEGRRSFCHRLTRHSDEERDGSLSRD